jgi:hypothetical protein
VWLAPDVSAFEAELAKEAKSARTGPPVARLIQRYIPNPLLINGKKFGGHAYDTVLAIQIRSPRAYTILDMRIYMLIACTSPFFVLQHDGYLRLRFALQFWYNIVGHPPIVCCMSTVAKATQVT